MEKKETNAIYGSRSLTKNELHHSVGAVLISNPTPTQQQQGNRCRTNFQERHYTKINISLSHVLQYLLKVELVTLRDPPQNPDTSSPKYNPNAKCA